ncbi:hypothetical protein [Chondromyces crocatus]|uniref:Uncharacterized protein n=1 Tax=Chondromyces crocatus TaxID=52 RepID=A0A0K1ED89_CHOCO|nr:hypothetical protein [Chondromyces crocatus]AKT38840.1 uncharacterized protein CMC5_029860 [Chondromyces crocatus]
MASVFSLLLDTLPLTVAFKAACRASGSPRERLTVNQILPFVRALPKSGRFSPTAPSLPRASTPFPARRLWKWTHDGGTPNHMTDLTCRVRDTGYKTQLVTRSIVWGHEEDGGPIQPFVRVVRAGGEVLDLPLSPDFLHSRWLVTGGWMGQGESHRFPLETYLDSSLVLAFAYDLAGPRDGVSAYRPPDGDPGELAISQYMAGSGSCPDEASDRWLTRALAGDFMRQVEEARPAAAEVGGSARITVSAPRVLVVLSFATCRERADFEPGGLVGMARFYPQIMVRASVPLRSVHGSVRLTRPATTTVLDRGDGTVEGTCCNAYEEIKSLLVADMNEDLPGPDDAYKPFWSGTFSHYEVDPDRRFRQRPLHVVRRDLTSTRTIASCGVRDLPTYPSDLTSVTKLPRQGEFDNIHVAPRLRLPATHILIPNYLWGSVDRVAIDPGRMRLDPIVMAPFCAHDCLHMHWRWGPGTARWTLGWGSAGPYTEPGAPLVPPYQDVDITMHGPNEFTYTEHVHPRPARGSDAAEIPADRWSHLVYAGAAYAQGIVEWRQSRAASVMAFGAHFRTAVSGNGFADATGRVLAMFDAPAVLYWNLRYYAHRTASGDYEAREWLSMSRADVDRARLG